MEEQTVGMIKPLMIIEMRGHGHGRNDMKSVFKSLFVYIFLFPTTITGRGVRQVGCGCCCASITKAEKENADVGGRMFGRAEADLQTGKCKGRLHGEIREDVGSRSSGQSMPLSKKV